MCGSRHIVTCLAGFRNLAVRKLIALFVPLSARLVVQRRDLLECRSSIQ